MADVHTVILEALREANGVLTVRRLAKKVGRSRLATLTAVAELASKGKLRVRRADTIVLVELAEDPEPEATTTMTDGGGPDPLRSFLDRWPSVLTVGEIRGIIREKGPLSARELAEIEIHRLPPEPTRSEVRLMARILALMAERGLLVRRKLHGVYYYAVDGQQLEEFIERERERARWERKIEKLDQRLLGAMGLRGW